MEFYRAKEYDEKYIKCEKSFIHNTALIAEDSGAVKGVLEYEIKNIEEAEITNFNLFEACEELPIIKGFIDELKYWNPHIKRVVYDDSQNSMADTLINLGFIKNSKWTYNVSDAVEAFKIRIRDITPEQLTVDEEKLSRVSSWIDCPEDVVVCCVKIDDKIVSIDGHSRLVAAFRKGFDYVYAFLDPGDNDIEFFKNCLKWCIEDNIYSIEDLSGRVVTPEKHQRIWCDRCQAYLREHSNDESK